MNSPSSLTINYIWKDKQIYRKHGFQKLILNYETIIIMDILEKSNL